MPPAKSSKESTKTVQKKKEKIIEDKTFGLKNKKGSKQQKFIKNVQQQVSNDPNQTKKKDKPKKEEDEFDFNKLFKPIFQEQKIKIGVDPKSQLCLFFKQGTCLKGNKCKFSHDLTVERRAEKRSVYDDIRNEDDMTNWDDTKLEEVVSKKHSEENQKANKTDIICKHFLKALEDEKYGWFWECPDGGDKCIYRHALPPGYTLKQKGSSADKESKALIEDLLDQKVSQVKTAHTKLTLETFRQWKTKRLKEKRDKAIKDATDKEAKYRAGKILGLSGRDIFTFDPSLMLGDTVYEPNAKSSNNDFASKYTRSASPSDILKGISDGVIDASLFLQDEEEGELDDDVYDFTSLNQKESHEDELELKLDNLIELEMSKPITQIKTMLLNGPTSQYNDNTNSPISSRNDEIDDAQDMIELISKKIESAI